jgi:hypothetical protein
MFGAFIGGWELLLILAVVGVMIGIAVAIVAIIFFVANRRKPEQQTTKPPQVTGR